MWYICIYIGAYGSVWRCSEKGSGRNVAIKKLKDVSAVGTDVRCSRVILPCEEGARLFTFANAPQDYEFAIREVKLLQYLSHENIVQLLEVSCVVPNLL